MGDALTPLKWDLDSPSGHIFCALLIFATGVCLYLKGLDMGKEIMAGALGSLWTLLQVKKTGQDNIHPQVVNQAETITVSQKGEPTN